MADFCALQRAGGGVSVCTDITCITQVTFVAVNNALLVDDWWFWLVHLKFMLDFPACKD